MSNPELRKYVLQKSITNLLVDIITQTYGSMDHFNIVHLRDTLYSVHGPYGKSLQMDIAQDNPMLLTHSRQLLIDTFGNEAPTPKQTFDSDIFGNIGKIISNTLESLYTVTDTFQITHDNNIYHITNGVNSLDLDVLKPQFSIIIHLTNEITRTFGKATRMFNSYSLVQKNSDVITKLLHNLISKYNGVDKFNVNEINYTLVKVVNTRSLTAVYINITENSVNFFTYVYNMFNKQFGTGYDFRKHIRGEGLLNLLPDIGNPGKLEDIILHIGPDFDDSLLPEGIVVLEEYNNVMKGKHCHVNRQELELIKRLPGVMVEHVSEISTAALAQRRELTREEAFTIASQTTDAYIPKVGCDHSSQISGNGSGSLAGRLDINVFIVDTGIHTHSDLNVVGGMNFTTTNSSDWVDRNGHGTHVAGIAGGLDNSFGIVGSAPGVRLWAIKVLGDNGTGSSSNLINALEWIKANRNITWYGYGIVNMSLTGSASASIDAAVRNLTDSGIVVVAAAGNYTMNVSGFSPSREYTAITVGATSYKPGYLEIANYSNYGSLVDILAPGSSILSTYLNNQYALLSGTSMAAPVVTGTCALIASTLNLGAPNGAGYPGNVSNTIKYVSGFYEYPNYDHTVTPNPRIILSSAAASSGTTDISIRSGTY